MTTFSFHPVKPLTTARVAGTVRLRANLLDGGDFEVGQRNFSVYGARWTPSGACQQRTPGDMANSISGFPSSG